MLIYFFFFGEKKNKQDIFVHKWACAFVKKIQTFTLHNVPKFNGGFSPCFSYNCYNRKATDTAQVSQTNIDQRVV